MTLRENITLPEHVRKVLVLLQDAGFEAYAVGGCVRDLLLGKQPSDYDVTTNALPAETEEVFRDFRVVETGMKHGTVTVLAEGEPIEITTYRIDGEYRDGRHPEKVTFTRNLTDDLSRRDFTINAMACSLDGSVVDVFSGKADLAAGVIRCVGNPYERFTEDALRIMRALRFASVLGFRIESRTAEAVHQKRELLNNIAAERITGELLKFLCGDGETVTELLLEFRDVFAFILPELEPCFDFDQKNTHHIYDVYEHIAHAAGASEPLPDIRLALLLHDIGKPDCFFLDENGVGHFYGHAERSEELAESALSRLRLPNDMRDTVLTLVRYHDYPVEPTKKGVRKRLNKFGPEILRKLMYVKYGDNAAHNLETRDYSGLISEILGLIDETLVSEDDCFDLRKLNIDGNDVRALGFEGPAIGEVLSTLLGEVMDETLENEHIKLLERAKELGTGKD